MTLKLTAPWSAAAVAALNAFQTAGTMHPFTCPRHDDAAERILVAEPGGWVCPSYGCSYTQDWAHPFMALTPAPSPAGCDVTVNGQPCTRPERHNVDDLHYHAPAPTVRVDATLAPPVDDVARMLADAVEWREQITPVTLLLDRIETALRYQNIETRGHLIVLLPPGMLPTVTHMYGYTVRRLDGIDAPMVGYLP